MKKRINKKLVVKKITLAYLNPKDLEKIQGGLPNTVTCTKSCPSPCLESNFRPC